MDVRRENEPAATKTRTTVERKSERELVVRRTFNGPARLVFEAWTKPELLERWWAPKSTGVPLRGGQTLLVMHELHPTKEALDEALAGMESGTHETFEQLDELLLTLGTSGGRS